MTQIEVKVWSNAKEEQHSSVSNALHHHSDYSTDYQAVGCNTGQPAGARGPTRTPTWHKPNLVARVRFWTGRVSGQ
jgi:hypothetical protein